MSDLSTILRRDTVGALPALTSASMYTNALAIVSDDGGGNVALRKWNGTSWIAATLGSGSLGTLAGDVNGAAGANAVFSLSGSGGIVTVKADQLSWEANSGTFLISQLPQTTNQAPNDFALVLGTPWVSATLTNRDAPDGGFWIPPPTAGGATGRWIFYVSDIERFAVEATRLFSSVGLVQFEASLAPIISQLSIAGPAHSTTLASQTSSTHKGGNFVLLTGGGGGGNLHGDMQFIMGGTRAALVLVDDASPSPIFHLFSDRVKFDESLTAPMIYIAPRTTDAPARRLRIRSQDAFASAVTNVTSGDIWYEIGPSVGDPPNPGQHVFWIGGLDKVEINKGALTLVNVNLSFRAPSSSNFTIKPIEFPGVGHSVIVEGGPSASAGNNGGAVALIGGLPGAGGLRGQVTIAGQSGQGMVTVFDVDATHHAVALCANAVPANMPSNMTNFIYVGDEAGVPTSDPVGGHAYASVSGNPWWLTSNGNSFMFVGSTHGSAVAAPLPNAPGTFYGWVGFVVNNTNVAIPAWNR